MITLQRFGVKKIVERFAKYTSVGITTYLLDIGIIAVLTYFLQVHYAIAVAIGFFVGVTINYHITYNWVFTGTERKKLTGYAIFGSLGILGIFLITSLTMLLVETFDLQLFIARTLVGASMGLLGFFVNSYFNFRML